MSKFVSKFIWGQILRLHLDVILHICSTLMK